MDVGPNSGLHVALVMSNFDPNGKEAGAKFLAENKGKDGIITLASGLQYEVLVEGAGLKHPTVDSPCDCHYAGQLLDGTEFDSSYSRGKPSTFAPNQVIKGWTEAMQLMVRELQNSAAVHLPWHTGPCPLPRTAGGGR